MPSTLHASLVNAYVAAAKRYADNGDIHRYAKYARLAVTLQANGG